MTEHVAELTTHQLLRTTEKDENEENSSQKALP